MFTCLVNQPAKEMAINSHKEPSFVPIPAGPSM